MAKLMAKCVYCGASFDRNTTEFVSVNARRYAHKKCYDEIQSTKTQDEKDYESLITYIKQKFAMQNISAKITRQITDYKKQYNFTYSGMLKALI